MLATLDSRDIETKNNASILPSSIVGKDGESRGFLDWFYGDLGLGVGIRSDVVLVCRGYTITRLKVWKYCRTWSRISVGGREKWRKGLVEESHPL